MQRLGILQGRVRPDDEDGPLQLFPSRWDAELESIAELGFGCVELLDDKDGRLRALVQPSCEPVIARARDCGLAVHSICMDRLCDGSLLAAEGEFLTLVSELVESFADVPRLRFVVPFFDANHIRSVSDLRTCVRRLGELHPRLADRASCLALECDLPAADVLEGLSDAPTASMGVCYDLGNAIGMGYDLADEIHLLGDRIVHVHVKDKVDGSNVPLRRDDGQLADGFRALHEVGYAGPLVLETWIRPDPLAQARRNLDTAARYLRGKGKRA